MEKMDNDDYIKKMDRIGFKLIFTITILAIWAICSNQAKYLIMRDVLIVIIMIIGVAGIIYAEVSSKKQFNKHG